MSVTTAESEWWVKSLLGEKPPLHDDTPPQQGYYKRRVIARGPFVPVRIWTVEEYDDDGELLCDVLYFCEVNGQSVDAFNEWQMVCKYPIARDEYERMMDVYERTDDTAIGQAEQP